MFVAQRLHAEFAPTIDRRPSPLRLAYEYKHFFNAHTQTPHGLLGV